MRAASATILVLSAAALAAAPGCVERKLVLRSDPPGAVVHLEDEPVEGVTPVEVDATWDGVRRVTLQAPGHRVLETTAEVKARWHDYFPLDAIAEFLWPGTIRDVQEFDFRLEPYPAADRRLTAEEVATQKARLAELRARADAHRAGGNEGPTAAAAPSDVPAPPAPRGAAPPPPPSPRGTAPAAPVAPTTVAPPAPPRAPQVPVVDLPEIPARPETDDVPKPTPPGQQLPPPVVPPAPVKK